MFSIILNLSNAILQLILAMLYGFEGRPFMCGMWAVSSACWFLMTGMRIKEYKENK